MNGRAAGHDHAGGLQPDRDRRTAKLPCDPGGAFPRAVDSCGRRACHRLGRRDLRAGRDGAVVPDLPRRRRGAALRQAHSLEFPFPNDHYDAGLGERRVYAIDGSTVCTGILAVGHRLRLADHRVGCDAFARAVARRASVPAVLWLDGGSLVQLSELYRP